MSAGHMLQVTFPCYSQELLTKLAAKHLEIQDKNVYKTGLSVRFLEAMAALNQDDDEPVSWAVIEKYVHQDQFVEDLKDFWIDLINVEDGRRGPVVLGNIMVFSQYGTMPMELFEISSNEIRYFRELYASPHTTKTFYFYGIRDESCEFRNLAEDKTSRPNDKYLSIQKLVLDVSDGSKGTFGWSCP